MLSVDVNALLISDLNCTFVSAPVIIRFSRSLLSNLKLTRELEPCVFLVKPLIEGNTTPVRQRHLSESDICPNQGTRKKRHLSEIVT